ncbi:hypothetical protein GCM10011511_14850 [Puia dinghuensis]|uniref:Uncharacterized protein n=1 Tax=Puia dinghuensis TaxID=1792502 RepID=A0A8J2UB97_9BACT|nr:hypothetical protein GCM10011511_14850 [Puia dinghuensis]
MNERSVKVRYVYDFNSRLEDSEKIFTLRSDNTLAINFREIPNLSQLASIKVEYSLNPNEKRYVYLTENKIANIREGAIPNIIGIEFIEVQRKEIVYRTIKGVLQNNLLVIVSASKTKATLPDYFREIEFENGYVLQK